MKPSVKKMSHGKRGEISLGGISKLLHMDEKRGAFSGFVCKMVLASIESLCDSGMKRPIYPSFTAAQ